MLAYRQQTSVQFDKIFHVAILQKGTLITNGPVDEILVNEDIVEVGAADIQQLLAGMQYFPGASAVKLNEHHVELHFPQGFAKLEAINRYSFEKGIVLNHLRLRKKSLESKFMELTN